jgi:ABC-type molybdenum transport system ATPase subunit/photorepair protein PhrA
MQIGTTVLEWLEMPTDNEFLGRPFGQLSQGEQKLVLISAALASRPQLLVLDEPCQGLDLVKRKRILGVVERICQATNLSLIYITHHPEEVLPSVSHVLHLAKGQEVYQGLRKDYDPKAVAVKIERLELNNNGSSGKGGSATKTRKRTLL